jgi:hypothetical protein
MTRGDIEGRDQETDDDGEIKPHIRMDESGLAEKKPQGGMARSAFVRPTTVRSPEQ